MKALIAVLGVKPEPVTVIPEVPAAALVEDSEIAGAVMVNVVEAVSALLSLPVAVTVYPPAELDGTVNVQLKVPVADVV